MGYFALPNGESKDDYINAAIRNLELFLEANPTAEYRYLLDQFVMVDLKSALTAEEIEKED